MHLRGVIALALGVSALLCAGRARAWQEVHEASDEMRVHVDAQGRADVDERVGWHVVHGPVKQVDVRVATDADAPDPAVAVLAEDGREVASHAVRADPSTLRVFVDDPHAALRGALVLRLQWTVDLVAAGQLVRDAGTWRMAWFTAPATDALDAVRVAIDVPAAPDPPRPIVSETGAADDGAMALVHRDAERDTLDLLVPHLVRGQRAEWTVRVDAKAFSALTEAERLQVGPHESHAREGGPEAAGLVALAFLGTLFTWLVRVKSLVFAAECARQGFRPKGLVPLPPLARALLAGACLAFGVALQAMDRPTLGALMVAAAAFFATLRRPARTAVARGPGSWRVLRPHEAFALPPPADHWFDAGTKRGRLTVLSLLLAGATAAIVASRWFAPAPWLAAIDAVALVPLFFTGCPSQRSFRPASVGRAWLERMHRRLDARDSLRVVPWGRVTLDGAVDEVRILVLPRASAPGFVGIEIGLPTTGAGEASGGGMAPELLVRVLEGTFAATQLARLLPGRRAVVGRRPDERVVRVIPRVPLRTTVPALAHSLAEAFSDRRTGDAARGWTGPERRVPVRPTSVHGFAGVEPSPVRTC